MRLTPAQSALLRRIQEGCGYVTFYWSPGALKGNWYIRRPYSDEDGRTCGSLADRNLLRHIGDNDWEPTPEALACLDPQT